MIHLTQFTNFQYLIFIYHWQISAFSEKEDIGLAFTWPSSSLLEKPISWSRALRFQALRSQSWQSAVSADQRVSGDRIFPPWENSSSNIWA